MLASLRRVLAFHGFEPFAYSSAEEALAAALPELGSFDAVVTDLNMPGTDGIELMARIKEADPQLLSIVLTGYSTMENAVAALRMGAFEFLEKPFSNEQLAISIDRAVEMRRLRRQLDEYRLHLEDMLEKRTKDLHATLSKLDNAYINTMEIIVTLLELREPSTAHHSKRTSNWAVLLAKKMGISDEKLLEAIRRGALLHDIGKIGIPDAILKKEGKLTDEEKNTMSSHSEIGHKIVCSIPDMEEAAEIVLSHHEHFDGSGYPRGLSGDQICIGARILGIIDTYDAIRFSRCYREGAQMEAVLDEISRCSGSQFDPEVVKAFLAISHELEQAQL
ncbi:MAG: hypothetical protein A2X49_01045 [Lentisphaerae bacterium GWF2_52_8]|nr:MAG: hypothetical protein A2X49_01045 [Lentisphaerae bacterium GWF2_52_8]